MKFSSYFHLKNIVPKNLFLNFKNKLKTLNKSVTPALKMRRNNEANISIFFGHFIEKISIKINARVIKE